jgi:hypothetical protein
LREKNTVAGNEFIIRRSGQAVLGVELRNYDFT